MSSNNILIIVGFAVIVPGFLLITLIVSLLCYCYHNKFTKNDQLAHDGGGSLDVEEGGGGHGGDESNDSNGGDGRSEHGGGNGDVEEGRGGHGGDSDDGGDNGDADGWYGSADGEDGNVEEGTRRPWEVVFLFLFLCLIHTVEVVL